MPPDKSDITHRLRTWTHAVDAAPASDLMDEAAAEIDRLREAIRRLAEQDATLSVCDGSVTVTMDATLTDAEREAIRRAAAAWAFTRIGLPDGGVNATLRGLLDRLSPIAKRETDRPEPIANDARLAALERLVASDQELERDYPAPDNAPKQDTTPPAWMARPFWVDPPSGHRYGFPKIYDRAYDGDMTEWLIRNGYPEHLAKKNMACTFTATE